MKAALYRRQEPLHYYQDNVRVDGLPPWIEGTPNPQLTGEVSPVLTGELSPDLTGDVTGVFGDVTGIAGNLDDCKLSPREREWGVDIMRLVSDKR